MRASKKRYLIIRWIKRIKTSPFRRRSGPPPSGGWEALAAQLGQRQPEAIAQLNQMYHQLFNQHIKKGCGNCYTKAFFRIRKELHLRGIDNAVITQRNYQLKPGSCIQANFGGEIITNANLTDEIAEQLIKAHPALIKHFERHPQQ